LHSDQPPTYQTRRSALYQQALDALVQHGLAYPCACSRKDIDTALSRQGLGKPRHGELIYPGTCREGLAGRVARAWRFRTDIYRENTPSAHEKKGLLATISIANRKPLSSTSPDLATLPTRPITWMDRRLGRQQQDVQAEVGDFVLQRADGCFAYQLAVVVDDGAQGITDIVRGEDLADNTARQILLQRALGLPTPRYLHTPLVRGADGDKLSKQNGATPIDTATDAGALEAIRAAACALGLPLAANTTIPDKLHTLTAAWKDRHGRS
jgi:glutamyl-Q tRNA(Asp) synthetase